MAPSIVGKMQANFCVLFLFIFLECNSLACIHYARNDKFNMSSEAQRGDVITKLCYNEDEQLTSNISPSYIQSPILFGEGSCGELTVLETLVYCSNYPINTTSKTSRFPGSITESIHIYVKNKTDILHFPRTVYKGYLHHSLGKFSVLGVESLFAITSDGTSHNISYKLDGEGCEDFQLDPLRNNGRMELLVKFRHRKPEKKYHLTVLAEKLDGRMGCTHLWIYANRSLLEIDAAKHKPHMENITNMNMSIHHGTTFDDINYSATRCPVFDSDHKGSRRKDQFPDDYDLKVLIRAILILVPLCLILLLTNTVMCLQLCGYDACIWKQPSENNEGVIITVNRINPSKVERLVKESTSVPC